MVKIIQWNCRSLFQRTSDLSLLIEKLDPEIFCLSEIKLIDSCTFSFPNYNIVACNRTRQSGGAAILIRKNIPYCTVTDACFSSAINDAIDITCISITLQNSKHLNICSLYSPPRNSTNFTKSDTWNTFLNSIASLGRVVICGDFNGHHSLWSNHNISYNNEGRKIESAADAAHLVCLNNGENTWCSGDLSSSSAIDITFASPCVAGESTWRVLDSAYGSDHFPLWYSWRISLRRDYHADQRTQWVV